MHEWHDIRLTAGQHNSSGDGLCLMEAVALFVGERHGDRPTCVCPVLIEFGRVLNDAMPDHWRTDLLLPLVPVLRGTREPGSSGNGLDPSALERRRAGALVAWSLHALPAQLVASGGHEEQRRGGAMGEAQDALRFGPAQHAARAAAAAVAWTAKGVWHRSLRDALMWPSSPGRAAEDAGRATMAV